MIRALVLAAAVAIMARAAGAAPLAAYGQLPDIEQVAISPDGARLAVLVAGGGERRILIREVDGSGEKLMSVGDIKVRQLTWAGPDDLLIASSTTARVAFVLSARREYLMLAAYNRHTGKVQRLMRDAENGLNVITSMPEIRMIDGKPVVLVTGVHFVSGVGRQALYRVELKYGRSKLVHPGFDGAYDWVVDAGGEPAAQATINDATGRWTLRIKRGAAWPEVKVVEAGQERPALMGLGRDGRSVLIATQQGEEWVLRELSPETGAMGEPLGDSDGDSLIFDPVSHKLIGVGALVGEEDRLSFFAPRSTACDPVHRPSPPARRVPSAFAFRSASRTVAERSHHGWSPSASLATGRVRASSSTAGPDRPATAVQPLTGPASCGAGSTADCAAVTENAAISAAATERRATDGRAVAIRRDIWTLGHKKGVDRRRRSNCCTTGQRRGRLRVPSGAFTPGLTFP